MSAGAATNALPLASDPVALHAHKLRVMLTDIRANHPDKGHYDILPWSKVAAWVNNNPSVSGGEYNYSPSSIRLWHSGKNPSTPAMLSSMSAYCVANSEYQAREMRADARNMKRAADEAAAVAGDGDNTFMSPEPKRRRSGPEHGSRQAATPVIINNTEYLTPPQHVIITKRQLAKYKEAEEQLAELRANSARVAAEHVP